MSAPELIIDSFAGGGGASTGIEMALGRSPDIAINHDRIALAMHAANHPATVHLDSNIWDVSPAEVCQGRPVGLLWASPDCKHFSKAKGGKPLDRNIRDLAWVVVRWAEEAKPRVILLENVEEFRTWGPLYEDGSPIVELRGQTFEDWLKRLRRAGYKVEWRELRACDYGAPTIRKRLFVIARRDGRPIVWPAPTHGAPSDPDVVAGRKLPWRTAAEIIDWSLPCPSIFLTREEARKLGVKRPLADATMARIAKGVKRYVLDAAEPFIVSGASPFVAYGQQGGAVRPADAPLHTITASRKDTNVLVTPFVTKFNTGSTGHGLGEPLHTITSHASDYHGGGAAPLGLVAPYLVPRYGERDGQEPRTRELDRPVPTIVPTGNDGSLVAAFLAEHNEGPRPGQPGRKLVEPTSTVTTTGAQQGLVAAHLLNLRGSDRRDQRIDAPAPTVSAGGNHAAAVAAFLVKYYGEGSIHQPADDPLHTVTTKPHHGVVTVTIAGEPYVIADIGMRMLTPRERFLAQGFPAGYVIDLAIDGRRITAEQQGRAVGNSVCPPLAAALVEANCADLAVEREAA